MRETKPMGMRKASVALAVVLAMAVATVPAVGLTGQAQALQAASPAALQVSTQSSSIDKAAARTAKSIVNKAKATKGSNAAKLKKIYAYIAKDKSNGGAYQSEGVLFFWSKYGSKYYAANLNTMKNTLVKKYYKKYAVDMQKEKKGSCYNYASLFAVAAKQALGKKATVKVAVGPSKHTGTLNKYHAWTEVKIGKKTYVYDTQAGNNYSKDAASPTDFGPYCGSLKSKLKSNYNNYKGVKYTTVTL